MKKLLIIIISLFEGFACFAQASQSAETVGNPTNNIGINTYTGWSTAYTFTGTAQVQNQNPSTNAFASGGGNVFFNNTPGIVFEAAGFNYGIVNNGGVYVRVTFLMYNYDTVNNNSNELVLEYTTNNGLSYQQINYQRLGGSMFASGLWNAMEGVSSIPLPSGSFNFKTRFRQTSSVKQFRIDDIDYGYVALLPLKIIDFTSAKNDNGVLLNFTAESSSASEKFILEKSNNAIQFSPVTIIAAKGNGVFKYNFTDASLNATGKVFYRIQMQETNSGKVTYSQILSVNMSGKKNTDLISSIFPIPATNTVSFTLNSLSNTTALVEAYNANGIKVLSTTKDVFKGDNTIVQNISKLQTGNYILKITIGDIQQTKQLAIIK